MDEALVDLRSAAVTLPTGATRYLLTARDASERIDAEVRLLRLAAAERTHVRALEAVIGAMEDGVALVAPEGRITVANDALALMAGRPFETRAELEGLLDVELVDPRCLKPLDEELILASVRKTGRLLVVDDNSGMLDLFQRFLDGTPWQVLAASSGEEARKLLTEKQPRLVILDVILPEEDGWEVLISLKANPATREIPVIVCSAINEPQLMSSLGAAAYLPKPLTRPALLQALQPWNCPAASPALRPPRWSP